MTGQRSNVCLGESKIASRRSQIEQKGWSGDRTLALASEHQAWFIGDQDAHGEAGMRPPNTTRKQTNQPGHRAGYLLPRRLQMPTYGTATKDEKDE